METTTITMTKLVASNGYVLYNGEQLTDKVYCKADDVDKWEEVTTAQAAEIQAEMDAAAEAAESEAETTEEEETTEE